MRRLLRILLNAATAASLVLCAATLVLWAASTRQPLEWGAGHSGGMPGAGACFTAGHSGLLLQWADDIIRRPSHPPARCVLHVHLGALAVERWDYGVGGHWTLYVHTLAACLAVSVLPALRLRAFRHGPRNRRAGGLCPHYGYDLRATPDRCPECGHITKKNTPAHASTAR
jgi:hypothetical protein